MEAERAMGLKLGAGETLRVYLAAGSALLVTAGRVDVRGPGVWLAETLLVQERTLLAEQYWLADAAGWIELSAPQGARVMALTGELPTNGQ